MINVRLLNLLSDARKYILYQIITRWLIFVFRIIISYLASNLVDSYINNILTFTQIKISLFFSLLLIFFIYHLEKKYIDASSKSSLQAKKILRKKIYSKLLKLGISYSKHISTSNLVQLSVEGVDQLETCFGQYYPQIFYSLLSTFTSLISISKFNIKTAFALLSCIPLIPISIIVVQKISKKILGKYMKSYFNLGERFLENLQGLTTLKIYQFDSDKEKEMDTQAEKFRINTMKLLVFQLNSISIMDIMTYGGASFGIILTLKSYYYNNITFGQALFIILLSAEFFLPLRRLGSFFHVAMNGITASEKIFKFLDIPEEKKNLLFLKNNEQINIEIKNMYFNYDTKEKKDILKNINIEIKNNEFIALVGESGCGKSTIAKILAGILKDYKGNITIQNKELKLIDENSLSKNIILLSNDSYIFKGSVKDNLLMAKNNATNDEMINIIKKVELDELIKLNGLDTPIEEEGNNLSGGQKQKLALARGLLVNAPFYIFDEVTSNIDKESEEDILKIIKSLAGYKSILFISHRLQNVVNCNRIYLLNKNGEITECGKHNELIALKGEYYKLFQTQKNLENYSSSHKKQKKINIFKNQINNNLTDNNLNINNSKQKSDDIIEKFSIICFLFSLAKVLMGIMLIAIILGSIGFLCAIFISIKGVKRIFDIRINNIYYIKYISFEYQLILISISIGLLKYGEQFCNHYIAFKLLAEIRHKIFNKLRTLCPAKLENKEKGNLISLITSDIELIEVFYAHTISPVAIAIIVSTFMTLYISSISIKAGFISFLSYIFIGVIIPLIFTKKVEKISLEYRNKTGDMNSFMLRSLRGVNEILQFSNGDKRLNDILNKSDELSKIKLAFSDIEQKQKAITSITVMVSSYGIFYFLLINNYLKGIYNINNFNNSILYEIIMPMVCLMSSFGPVIALSNLSIGLGQTLACGKRVKNLLDEAPVINEINTGVNITQNNKTDISINNVNFSYDENLVLKNMNMTLPGGKIIGILGKSGCGKSTLLKLIMRFWDVDKGEIKIGNDNIKNINTNELRKYESYLTQRTHLFNDTIEQNIKLAKKEATINDIISAAKKASIHDFIMSLPKKYETNVGELGNLLSSGEKQRIGLARAFLHGPKLLLLDEPTSNLDSLNEAIILKSILEEKKEYDNKDNKNNDKTIIIVSHRASTLDCVDALIKFE